MQTSPPHRRARASTLALDASVDAGLRSYMVGVYNKLGLGLIASAGAAWAASSWAPLRDALFVMEAGAVRGYTPLGLLVAFAPLVILLGATFFMRKAASKGAGALYWTIVTLVGLSLGVLALTYTGQSLVTTFLVTAAAFGGLSLVGYTTKKDLTGFGSFLIMGVIGLIVASVVNLFLQSSAVGFAISALGVLIFAGLTAYDTQRLKLAYYELGGDETARAVTTNYGALSLYLNFINMFQFLLALFGQRR
jgi:FtsH-binding integral membrane protein